MYYSHVNNQTTFFKHKYTIYFTQGILNSPTNLIAHALKRPLSRKKERVSRNKLDKII